MSRAGNVVFECFIIFFGFITIVNTGQAAIVTRENTNSTPPPIATTTLKPILSTGNVNAIVTGENANSSPSSTATTTLKPNLSTENVNAIVTGGNTNSTPPSTATTTLKPNPSSENVNATLTKSDSNIPINNSNTTTVAKSPATPIDKLSHTISVVRSSPTSPASENDLQIVIKKNADFQNLTAVTVNSNTNSADCHNNEKYLQNEECAASWLRSINAEVAFRRNKHANLDFNYLTDLSDANQKKVDAYNIDFSNWIRLQKDVARKFKADNFTEPIRRQLDTLVKSASSSNSTIRERLTHIGSQLEKIYATARICAPGQKKCPDAGEIGPQNFMRNSIGYEELTAIWVNWRNATGRVIRSQWIEMIDLENQGAKEHGYKDRGHYEWSEDFESEDFNSVVMSLYSEIEPLYKQLHAYTRFRLAEMYAGKFDNKSLVPNHLFGDMWAQEWTHLFSILKPYPGVSSADMSEKLHQMSLLKKTDIHKEFKDAEAFFVSLGLFEMTPNFWNCSMFVKPKNKNKKVQCHASAHDFSNKEDYRIKMCADISQGDITTIHHEMGHIEYFMAYRDQPPLFQGGANSGFHEAIGDTIALSVNSPEHLKEMNYLEELPAVDSKADINYLMSLALMKIAFIPYALVVDIWRWQVYNATYKPDEYNEGWWKLVAKYQGMKPPVPRSPDDLDAASKYHVAVGIPYIRYFVSFILQFQFYKALCTEAGHKGSLHRCDFYKSEKAGKKLKDMMELGSSKPWPDALEKITGERKVSTTAILEYFEPLYKFLKQKNEEDGAPIGW